MSKLAIRVINLVHRDDRRRRASEQLDPTNLNYSFFEAVNREQGYDHFAGASPAT